MNYSINELETSYQLDSNPRAPRFMPAEVVSHIDTLNAEQLEQMKSKAIVDLDLLHFFRGISDFYPRALDRALEISYINHRLSL